MPGPIQTLAQRVKQLWTGKPAKPDVPEVIVHDPAAQAPHDLDDPFFDRDVQARMADVIANAGQTEKK